MKTIRVKANKTIRYLKNTYIKDKILEVREEDLVAMITAGNVSKIPGVDYEEKVEEAPEVIKLPMSFHELNQLTHEELNDLEKHLGEETKGKKEERAAAIWEMLSEGYEKL